MINDFLVANSNNLHKRKEAELYSFLGLAYYFYGKYDESAAAYLKSIKTYEELKDYGNLAYNYGEFGYQLKRRDLRKAEFYMQKAINIAKEFKLSEDILTKLVDNYGVIKEMKGEYDSAFICYNFALKSKEKNKDIYGIPYSLNKIAGLFLLQKKYDNAKRYLRRSDAYRVKENNPYSKADNLAMWGDLYFDAGQFDSAAYYYEKTKRIAVDSKYGFLIEYSLKKLSETHEKLGNADKAYYYFRRYAKFKDSVDNAKVKSVIAELEIAFDSERKNRIITTQELELKQYRLTIAIGITSLIFISIIIALLYMAKRKKEIQEKKELVLKAALRESELRKSFVEEKLKISRELHDNVGSRLTYIISSMDYLLSSSYQKDYVREKLNKLSKFSRQTLTELRDAVWTIKIDAGSLEDLILRLRNFLNSLAASKDKVYIHIEHNEDINLKEIRLNSIQMLNIYRIIQEALQNSLKYAQASEIKIIFSQDGDELKFSVVDDGKGFDLNSYIPGNGIENMKKRCEELGGSFLLDSSPSGTIVKCSIKIR